MRRKQPVVVVGGRPEGGGGRRRSLSQGLDPARHGIWRFFLYDALLTLFLCCRVERKPWCHQWQPMPAVAPNGSQWPG